MPNVFKDSNLSFHYNKNLDNSINIPNIYILNRRLKKIGQIEDITELEIVTSFNEPNEISFVTHKYINNRKNSLWKYIKETALVSVEGFGIFEIEAPITDTDSTIKKIHGQDLCAVELGQSNCTLEINTEEDYTSTVTPVLADVKPTLFYNENDTTHSLLHRILTYAPHYNIGHVDDSLCGMNRELSCSDSSIYDFLTGDVSETFGCIFVFDKFKRTINAYDLKDHCLSCGSHHIIGTECQDCKAKGKHANNIEQGYGYNSSAYVDTENLATEMTLTGEKDSLKNCFKLEAGDDIMTEMVGQRLIGGTNYIWTFSNEMLNDMSDELREKYTAYTKLVESYQSRFNTLWNNFNEYTNQVSYYKDNKFPQTETTVTTASEAWNLIKKEITYGCIANKNTVLSTLSKSILYYAKLLLPADYGVKFELDSSGNDKTSCTTTNDGGYNVITSWTGNLYVYRYNYTDDNGNDLDYVRTGAWTLPVKKGYQSTPNASNAYTNDYYYYLKRQLDYALAKSQAYLKVKHDSDYTDSVSNHLSDKDYYKNFFKEYNVTSLQSYYDAYNSCSVILNQLNSTIDPTTKYLLENGSVSSLSITNKLLKKYQDYADYISTIIKEYQGYIDDYNRKLEVVSDEITQINTTCNLRNYLGEELYFELLSFKREDVYKNENFTSEMSDNDTDLLTDIDEFILDAKEEIAKACQLQYSCTVSLGNLLLDKNFDYDKIYEKFALGNFIRLSIDDTPVKIRIIQMTFKFNDDIENLPITLSDALVGNSVIKDYQNVINNAKSMALSFQFITKQTDKNNKNLTSVVGKLRHEGLAAVNDMLNKAENISLTIDNQGLLGRKWNEDLNAYEDKQLRIINNVIGFTDNNWETVKTALGNIYYNGSWRYGLLADVIVGNIIAGENLTISDKGNNVVINGDGITLDGGAITWKTAISQSGVNGLEDDLNKITQSIKNNSDNIDSFKSEVNTQLSVAGVTKINNNYVFSPKISSGYLYIVKNGCSVQIDPLQNYDAQNDKVIDVQANNQDVFYIKRNGDGYFKGTIYAINGEFTGTISGSTISGSTISSSANGRSVDIANGRINLGGYVKIDSGLLNANSDQNNYSNALNFSCSGYPAEFGFRWQDTNVTMISNSSLTLGEQAYPIKDINMSGNFHIGNFHISSNLNDTWELDIYSNIDYPYLRLTQTNDALTIYPSKDSTVTLGKSDIRFANIYTMYVTTPSDRKLKKDIKKIDGELAEKFIDGLTPSSYSFKDNSYNKTHTGFIAQDVEKLLIDMGLKLTDFAGLVKTPKNIDNDPDNFEGADENYDYSLRYDDFIAPLVAYCQNLKKKNTELENKLNKIYEKLGLSD
ncbi:tail fiber domain-containing protein [Butyribacter intestini]|uniref:tail fiber domain-containing protein n=1 Tax=Butyribacter intestini TaxID=1703332 RepID=UPI0022E127E4|nr:tail fiber domain-containing protein [Butyribacter intestini]